jgi:hypothetical protein
LSLIDDLSASTDALDIQPMLIPLRLVEAFFALI